MWKNLAVGVGLTFVGSSSDLIVNAQIPDPDFFDSPRAVSTTLTDAKHRQNAINLTGTWMMPVTDKVDVGFQFGPTIFLVSQEVPGTLQVAEPGPTVTAGELAKDDHTTVGVHFGIDATYLDHAAIWRRRSRSLLRRLGRHRRIRRRPDARRIPDRLRRPRPLLTSKTRAG